jgi:hypothetical protein
VAIEDDVRAVLAKHGRGWSKLDLEGLAARDDLAGLVDQLAAAVKLMPATTTSNVSSLTRSAPVLRASGAAC